MPKEPGFYFYNGEWKRETSLALVTKAAKGCWMDMLVLLSECPVRGKFAHADGRPWTREEISTAIGLGACQTDISENMRCIDELLLKGVCSIDKRGAIFNRRMIRDQKIREKDAARQREFRRNQRLSSSKETKSVTHNVTSSVTPLSEEEIEIEKEVSGTCFSKQELPPNEIHLKVKVETFDSEEFVRRIREIYVPRGCSAPMVEVACFEAVEAEVDERKWRRSEAASYILDRTSTAAGLMSKWPKNQQNWWPTLYTFMHERRYNDEISTWERSDGSNGKTADRESAIGDSLSRVIARKQGGSTLPLP